MPRNGAAAPSCAVVARRHAAADGHGVPSCGMQMRTCRTQCTTASETKDGAVHKRLVRLKQRLCLGKQAGVQEWGRCSCPGSRVQGLQGACSRAQTSPIENPVKHSGGNLTSRPRARTVSKGCPAMMPADPATPPTPGAHVQ